MSDYPDLETMTRELWDIEQIKRVKRRNLRCLDMKLWDEMGETFHPDVTTSWVNGDLVLNGRDEVMKFMRSIPFAQGDKVLTVHQPTAPEIDLTGPGTAKGIWRLYNPMNDKDQGDSQLLVAFYIDEYTRLDGQWLISHTGHEYLWHEDFQWSDVPSHRMLWRRTF